MSWTLLSPVFVVGQIVCVPGQSVIGPWTEYWTPGPPAPVYMTQALSPWSHMNFSRSRHQYLVRAQEVDMLQSGSLMGLCTNEPIDSIAFYVDQEITSGDQKPYAWKITVKHTSLTTLTNFDETTDPLAVCAVSNDALNGISALPDGSALAEPRLGGPGWRSFKFASPFLWNGVDNIIVEFCYSSNSTQVNVPQVWCTPQMTGFSSSYVRYASNTAGTCSDVGGCGAIDITGCGMDLNCGAGQASTERPVILFGGIVSTISTGIPSQPRASPRCWFDAGTERISVAGGSEQGTEFAVHDMSGRRMLTGIVHAEGIDASSLVDGPYVIELMDGKRQCQRVMVVRF